MGKKANAINKVAKAIDASADASSNSVKGALKSLIVACDSSANPQGDSVPGLIEQIAQVVPSGGGGGGSLGAGVQLQTMYYDPDEAWWTACSTGVMAFPDPITDTMPTGDPSFLVDNATHVSIPSGLGVTVIYPPTTYSNYGPKMRVYKEGPGGEDDLIEIPCITEEMPTLFNPSIKQLKVGFTMPEVENGGVYTRLSNE